MNPRRHNSVLRGAAKKRRPPVSRLCAYCGAAFESANAKRRYCGRKCCDTAYCEANRDRIAKRRVAYRAANRDRIAKQKAAYYAANRDRFAAYRVANRDRIAKRKAAYRTANRERIVTYEAAYYAANRDRITKYKGAYRAAKRSSQARINRHSQGRVSSRVLKELHSLPGEPMSPEEIQAEIDAVRAQRHHPGHSHH
jgi:hypothetical protein